MLNFSNHTTNRGIVVVLNNLVHSVKTKSIECKLLCLGGTDTTSYLLNFDSSHFFLLYPLNTLLKLTPLF